MEAFIIIAVLILFIVISFNPKMGLYLMALFLPVLGIDFQIKGFIFPLIDLIALVSFAAFFLNRFYLSQVKRIKVIPLKWPLIWPFAFFFLASLISSFLSLHPGASLYYFVRWPLFLYFAYIFLPANIIGSVKVLKNVIILIFVSAMAVLFSSYLSLIEQNIGNEFFRLNAWSIKGIFPFGDNHNLIAEFLNIGVFFILIIKEFVKDRRHRRLINVIFILTALAIILTFSRTAWITLIIQLSIYFFYNRENKQKEKRNVVILILIGSLIAIPLIWRMSVLQANNTGSTASRVILSEIAFKAWQEKPLFGHGSGEFINLVAEDIRFVANHGEPMDSHGFIQKIAAENGLFGLLSWFLILIYLARFAFFAVKKYYPRVRWVLPFALAVGGGIFFQLFNTSYYKGKVWLPLILFIIAIEISEKKQEKKYVAKN